MESTVRSSSFITDSGASRHMVSTREEFSSLYDSKGPNIVSGYDSKNKSKGKGRRDVDHGSFDNVFYVPGPISNIFPIYLMTHIGYLLRPGKS